MLALIRFGNQIVCIRSISFSDHVASRLERIFSGNISEVEKLHRVRRYQNVATASAYLRQFATLRSRLLRLTVRLTQQPPSIGIKYFDIREERRSTTCRLLSTHRFSPDALSGSEETPCAIPLRAGNMNGRPRLANNSSSHADPASGNFGE